MKKHFLPLSFLFLLAPGLASCGQNGSDAIIIKALNCEDYIGEDAFAFYDEEGQAHDFSDVITGFEEYESARIGKKVKVIYDTYDTNETMLSSLKTGKTSYDLICASDYTIQKMMSMGMCQKIDLDRVENYFTYCSPKLLEVMEGITADIDGKAEAMSDYSIGYMWGTLGILYNPAKVAADKGLEEDEVKLDMSSWHSLWDEKYHNEMSVKDSMRDTYSVGIMKLFDQEIRDLMKDSGCFDVDSTGLDLLPGMYEEASGDYNAKLSDIFNRCDAKTTNSVKDVLLALKNNVYGFEVDSGKDDMVKGYIGMNLAWSGDAVYSMDRGENEAGNYIYYSIPSTGGNIWFDSWCIPKTSDAEHKSVAEDFLNFISDPQVAAANMETIGYTSFIAGDTVHELIRLWFDPRSYAMYIYHDASGDPDCTWEDNDYVYLEYEEDEEGELVPVPEEGLTYDEDLEIAYQTGFDLEEDDVADFDFEHGILNMAGSSYETAVIDGVEVEWPEYIDIYNAKAEEVNALIDAYNQTHSDKIDEIEELEEWGVRDLTYMFQGSLEDESFDAESLDPGENAFLFYTDEIEEIESEDGSVVQAGRQFYAQYPDQSLMPKLAVMRDYGESNIHVLSMWSEIKSNNLPMVAVIIFAILLVAAAIFIISFVAIKRYRHQIRVERRKEVSASLRK